VCAPTNNGTLTLSGHTGSVVRWESSTDNFVNNIVSINNATTSLSYSNLTTTTQYRAVVKSGACDAVNSGIATVTVTPATVGGIISSTQTICSGTIPEDLVLSGHVGNVVRWQRSNNAEFSTVGSGTVTDIANSASEILSGSAIGSLTATYLVSCSSKEWGLFRSDFITCYDYSYC
jgi:hypothetical protein